MGGLVLEMGIFLESHLLGEIYVLSGATSVSMPEIEQGSWPLALFTHVMPKSNLIGYAAFFGGDCPP